MMNEKICPFTLSTLTDNQAYTVVVEQIGQPSQMAKKAFAKILIYAKNTKA